MSIKQPLESLKEYLVTFWTEGWRMNYEKSGWQAVDM